MSNDPHFEEKLDAVGLYLDPPESAAVFSFDEKSSVQALDRTQPGLPLKPGRCGTMTHDYKRNGTTSLFVALEVASGTYTSAGTATSGSTRILTGSGSTPSTGCSPSTRSMKGPSPQPWMRRWPQWDSLNSRRPRDGSRKLLRRVRARTSLEYP